MEITIRALFLQAIYKPGGTYNGIAFKEKYILVFLDEQLNTLEFAVPTLPVWNKQSTLDNLLQGNLKYVLQRNPRNDRTGYEAFVSKYLAFDEIANVRVALLPKGDK